MSRSRGPRCSEHRACLVAQLAAGIAAGDVGQGEQPDLGVAGELLRPGAAVLWDVWRARSRSSWANVASWTSRSASWAATTSASHGPCRRTARSCARRARDRGPARAKRRRRSLRAAGGRSQARAPHRDSARARGRGVPGVRPRRARSRRRHVAVAHGDGGDAIAVARDRLGRLQLGDAEPIARAPVDEAHLLHERRQPRRPVDLSGALAFAQREGLEHAGQPQPVVGVEVCDEHAVDIAQADRADQLALRALAAVEQQAVAADARRAPPAGRAARSGTEPPVPAKKRDTSMGQRYRRPPPGVGQRVARTRAGKLCTARSPGAQENDQG